jgi:hypothetical protein
VDRERTLRDRPIRIQGVDRQRADAGGQDALARLGVEVGVVEVLVASVVSFGPAGVKEQDDAGPEASGDRREVVPRDRLTRDVTGEVGDRGRAAEQREVEVVQASALGQEVVGRVDVRPGVRSDREVQDVVAVGLDRGGGPDRERRVARIDLRVPVEGEGQVDDPADAHGD